MKRFYGLNRHGYFEKAERILIAEDGPFRCEIRLAYWEGFWRTGYDFDRHNAGSGGGPGIDLPDARWNPKRKIFATREEAIEHEIEHALEYFSSNHNSCCRPTPKRFLAAIEAARPTQAAFHFEMTT